MRYSTFSLRTLAMVIALLAVAFAYFGYVVRCARQEDEAVNGLDPIAVFDYDYEVDDDGSLTGADPPGAKWLRAVLGDHAFQHVVTVKYIPNCKLESREIRWLHQMPRLGEIEMDETIVSAEAIRFLPEAKQVYALSASRCPIDDEGMESIARMQNLQWLAVAGTQITDVGVGHLAESDTLQVLYLSDTKVTDASVDALASMKSLHFVFLVNTEVTESGAARLRAALSDCDVTADDNYRR